MNDTSIIPQMPVGSNEPPNKKISFNNVLSAVLSFVKKLWWCNIVRKHAAIAKAYLKATGRPK